MVIEVVQTFMETGSVLLPWEAEFSSIWIVELGVESPPVWDFGCRRLIIHTALGENVSWRVRIWPQAILIRFTPKKPRFFCSFWTPIDWPLLTSAAPRHAAKHGSIRASREVRTACMQSPLLGLLRCHHGIWDRRLECRCLVDGERIASSISKLQKFAAIFNWVCWGCEIATWIAAGNPLNVVMHLHTAEERNDGKLARSWILGSDLNNQALVKPLLILLLQRSPDRSPGTLHFPWLALGIFPCIHPWASVRH